LSNNNFVKIQDALIDLENNISASRRFYNTSIVAYNESIQMIPGVFMAQFLGMRSREIYSIAENEKETPDMKELFKK
jgi:LemA protein